MKLVTVFYGPNNTYKALRIVGTKYSLYYSVWCTNEHELYDLTVSSSRAYWIELGWFKTRVWSRAITQHISDFFNAARSYNSRHSCLESNSQVRRIVDGHKELQGKNLCSSMVSHSSSRQRTDPRGGLEYKIRQFLFKCFCSGELWEVRTRIYLGKRRSSRSSCISWSIRGKLPRYWALDVGLGPEEKLHQDWNV